MNMDKYKRDYNYKSGEGDNKGFTWLIILCAVIIVVVSLFL